MADVGRTDGVHNAIAEFWRWWDGQVSALTAALDAQDGGPWQVRLSDQVRSLHPGLQWELRGGEASRYLLCLSGGGQATLRLIAERWRSVSPDATADWGFKATRPAAAQPERLVFNVAGEAIALSELRVAVSDDPGRERINCIVFHPVFTRLPTATRDSVAVLLLDHALGEHTVETWVGAIDSAVDCPDDDRDIAELRAAIAWRTDTATGVHWGITTAAGPEGTLFQIVNYAVKRWATPLYDARCDVTFTLERPTPAGIPDPWESEAFEAIEDGLSRALSGHAVLVARTSGRQRHTVHFYAEGDGIAPAAIAAWAQRSARSVEVSWHPDPTWSVLTEPPSRPQGEPIDTVG